MTIDGVFFLLVSGTKMTVKITLTIQMLEMMMKMATSPKFSTIMRNILAKMKLSTR